MSEGCDGCSRRCSQRCRPVLPWLPWLLLPQDLRYFGGSLFATTLFSSNIFFWLEAGYFDVAAERKPLLHTWSLVGHFISTNTICRSTARRRLPKRSGLPSNDAVVAPQVQMRAAPVV